MATRNKKAIDAKKRQALQLKSQQPNLSVREIANLTGLSHSTVDRTLKKVSQDNRKETLFQGNSEVAPGVSTQAQSEDEEFDGVPLNFEDSPEPIEKKSLVDQGMDTLKGLLGIGDREEKKATPVLSAKLDPKRQAFVDSVTPTISLGFTLAAAWMWGRIGPDYAQLAPDEQTANRIIEPLVRIYARHASFLTDVNPDVADAGASLVALIGYVYTSLGIYQHIKQEKETNEQYTNNTGRGSASSPENRPSYQSSGLYAVPRNGRANGSELGGNGGSVESFDRSNLSPKEAQQLAALSRLSELDYQSRARRAGKL